MCTVVYVCVSNQLLKLSKCCVNYAVLRITLSAYSVIFGLRRPGNGDDKQALVGHVMSARGIILFSRISDGCCEMKS